MTNLEIIGQQIDQALDYNDQESLSNAIKALNSEYLDEVSEHEPIFHYFLANAYSGLKEATNNNETEWKNGNLVKEIYHLRTAFNSTHFNNQHIIFQCKILTNLGNLYSKMGRTTEAIAFYDHAIKREPKFAMALANRGIALETLAHALYDEGHVPIVLTEAHKSLELALQADSVWDSEYPIEVYDHFFDKMLKLKKYVEQIKPFDPFDFEINKNPENTNLFKWRLENKLFLNPLNQLGAWPVAAQDVLHLPSHTYKIGAPAKFPQFMDIIKQEYVSANVFYFESINRSEFHEADQNNLTFNHLNYSVFSTPIERNKVAFKMAYSIFDKIALFMNSYLSLNNDLRRIKFSNIWYENLESNKGIHPRLKSSNWRWKSLFWIAQDLYDKDIKGTLSPTAKRIAELRNAMEHRMLAVVELDCHQNEIPEITYVSLSELGTATLEILHLVRSAIMTVSFAMHLEEKSQSDTDDGLKISIPGIVQDKEY